jgi:alpha-L-fucosidase
MNTLIVKFKIAKTTIKIFLIVFASQSVLSCVYNKDIIPPINPVPTKRQLDWQQMEYYAFIHFNMNTFTNKEWGYGDESPSTFNPSELDTDQWAKIIHESGMKGIIITAKHHDGFSLWPSLYTEHSVKNSPWKNGKGDLIRDLMKSCKKYNLKLGVYLSPWDRNHPDYGKPEYLNYFRNQLSELLSNYGEIFEVWFDGANGGDGYYGGTNEIRHVDKKVYYQWEDTYKIVRNLQPNAVIFSDSGPDIRWVGNEKGYANETSWSNLYRDSVYTGMLDYNRFSAGQEFGTHWIPTETDVSIRPGWYYHSDQDSKVKSLDKLVDIYFNSVGLNSALLLNIPVDKRGLIHENDSLRLSELAKFLKSTFSNNLALEGKISTSSNNVKNYKKHINDNDTNTYWSSGNGDDKCKIEINFNKPINANVLKISEYIALGQRIKSFHFEIKSENEWKSIKTGTTIGNKRLIRFTSNDIDAIRITILETKGKPAISEIGFYKTPTLN